MEIIVEGKDIYSEKDFYIQIWKEEPDFGPYFGCNRSALRDYIGILDGQTVIWKNHIFSKNRLGNDFDVIVSIFLDRNKVINEIGGSEINLILK